MGVAIHINPAANTACTAVFATLAVAAVAILAFGTLPPSCPLAPRGAVAALVAGCVALAGAIVGVKRAAGALLVPISRRWFPGHPLGKRRTLRKLEDQCWQLALHATMTALEVYVLFYEEGDTASWHDEYWGPFLPHPRAQANRASLHLLYLLQLCVWIDTAVLHRFVEERHKDYFLMFAHHLVTIALLLASYWHNYLRIGVLVLYLHDVTDIVVDLLKIFNYCQLEERRGLFLTELAFVINMATWGYYRIYYFGYHVIYRAAFVGAREAMTHPQHAPGMTGWLAAHGGARAGAAALGHARGASFGDGRFDVAASIRALPTHACIAGYWGALALLATLLCMHVLWYSMFLRMLYRLVRPGGKAHDAGREVYEGDSDEDEPAGGGGGRKVR